MYRRERSLTLGENSSLLQRRRAPSFSSSLLDAIYRSIDESPDADAEKGLRFYYDKTISKNTKQRNCSVKPVEEANNIRRAIMIENWMEKQSSLRSTCLNFSNSTSTTSDSSSGVGTVFSSSEAESNYKDRSRRSKPARSMKCMQFEKRINEEYYNQQKQKPNPNREGRFSKTKLKALKIYGELKKVKRPISPGGRITSFLNSIFSSGNGKKVNVCTVKAIEDVNFDNQSKSGCSSATSFSRSCLSKTPSSRCRGKNSSSNKNSGNGMKRSVRFYPVSVIGDEDCRPCGHKCIYEDNPSLIDRTIQACGQTKSGCSSATSYSSSCLSKTPPSRCRGQHSSSNNNGANGMKRSVRFYPVGVIVDEDCKSCGHKCIYENDPSLLPSKNVKTNNYSLKLEDLVEEKETGASKLLARTSYPKKGLREFVSRATFTAAAEDDDEDEDDALSYSSSDLFELDHLKSIERYREELPVYETTNLKKNQAFGNRFIM